MIAHCQRRLALLSTLLSTLLYLALCLLFPETARAFGDDGAFHPRLLLVGETTVDKQRSTAPSRLAWELMTRTNAPARLAPTPVRANSPSLAHEPFAWWLGSADVGALTAREIEGLRVFFALGGVLFVDDSDPISGIFGKSVRRELARVLPNTVPVPIGPEHVVFRSFYLMRRPAGRIEGPDVLEAIVRNGQAQVLFSSHDVAGALAQSRDGVPTFPVEPGGYEQREMAIRMAVNVAMFVLCSNYKDDQVHAPHLMRRRARDR